MITGRKYNQKAIDDINKKNKKNKKTWSIPYARRKRKTAINMISLNYLLLDVMFRLLYESSAWVELINIKQEKHE